MKAAINKKLMAFVILLVILSSFAYYYRINTLERAYQKNLSEAVKAEKSGNLEKALKEYQEALASLPLNDSQKKAELKKKIKEIKEKIEGNKVAENDSGNGSSGNIQNGNNNASENGNTIGTTIPAVIDIKDLSALLPEKVFGIDGVIAPGKDIASARYDDVLSRTTYIIYINRFESADRAAKFVMNTSENIFGLNKKIVDCVGSYAGIKGYYGENEQKDAAIYFSYGNLAFELLLRSETLEQEKKLEKLLELQKEVKKP
jgi:transposase